MTEEYCTAAIKSLCSYTASATLMQINEEKYGLLRDGIPVSVKKKDGTTDTVKAKVFNFEEPEKNHFLAVKEMKIHGAHYRRRTDIVGFVNGIPLLFVELKKQTVDVQDAYNCNYTDYLDTIPQLFYFNAFLMLSNGLEAKVGTMGSKYEFFHEWKRLKEDEVGAVDLETMLLGICEKHNFMDLLENFILFDHSGGKTVKILARNHQYLGVNEAVESCKARKLKDGKLGVFWHTQGSGKSYSMVFFAQKVRRKFAGSPTFVILTDRDELNKQISDTFEACGCLSAKVSTYIPSSGSKLREMLKGNPSYIFTLIQKFNDNTDELIEKIITLGTPSSVPSLNRNLWSEGRIKQENERIYFNIEAINQAINEGKKIAFQYFQYDVKKKQKLKHDGALYKFSPYALVWNGDYYYMVGYSEKHDGIGNFRIGGILLPVDFYCKGHPGARNQLTQPLILEFQHRIVAVGCGECLHHSPVLGRLCVNGIAQLQLAIRIAVQLDGEGMIRRVLLRAVIGV